MGIGAVVAPVLAAIVLGVGIVLLGYTILTKLFNIDPANAGCIAGHYGAVSAATLAIVLVYVDRLGIFYEPFAPALYPFMDTAALITGIVLARMGLKQAGGKLQEGANLKGIIIDALVGKGVFLLFGGLLIGYLTAGSGAPKIMPFYDILFYGVLTLFLLEIGLFAGTRLGEFKKMGLPIIVYSLLMVPVHGFLGALVGTLLGLSEGGTLVLATLAASASYISAPAVMRAALPTANPSIALASSVLLVFPFNATVGIPLYHYFSELIAKLI